jgi:hypothetical protein
MRAERKRMDYQDQQETKFYIIIAVSAFMHESFCKQNIIQDLQNHMIVMCNS